MTCALPLQRVLSICAITSGRASVGRFSARVTPAAVVTFSSVVPCSWDQSASACQSGVGASSGRLPGTSYKRLFWLLDPALRTSIFMQSTPLPVGDFLRVDPVLFNVTAESEEDVLIMMYALAGSRGYTRITSRSQPDGLHDEVVAVGTIAHIHIKRRGGRALFLVAVDVEATCMIAPEKQLFHCGGIAVEVDDHRHIRREQSLKHLAVQAMWMVGLFLQYEEVGDVDHAYAQLGKLIAQNMSGCHDLQRRVIADTHQHDIRVNAIIYAGPLPDRGARAAVSNSVFHREPLGHRRLVRNDEVDIVQALQAVIHGTDQAVGIRRQVDARDLRFPVQDVID